MWCGVSVGSRFSWVRPRFGPSAGPPSAGPPPPDCPKLGFFSSCPPQISLLLPSLGGLLVEFGWCFGGPWGGPLGPPPFGPHPSTLRSPIFLGSGRGPTRKGPEGSGSHFLQVWAPPFEASLRGSTVRAPPSADTLAKSGIGLKRYWPKQVMRAGPKRFGLNKSLPSVGMVLIKKSLEQERFRSNKGFDDSHKHKQ